MKTPTINELKAAVIKLGFKWFSQGDYNLNIVGVRACDTQANTFNDLLCVAFYVDGQPHVFAFNATTDPGLYYRENPINLNGTAIVKEGQHNGLWQIGLHQGQYSALVQRKPIKVYRDNNRDQLINIDAPEQRGFFGINCHRANAINTSSQVDKWSAGCQVVADPLDFEQLMILCRQSTKRYSNSFTYTLINENNLDRSAKQWSH